MAVLTKRFPVRPTVASFILCINNSSTTATPQAVTLTLGQWVSLFLYLFSFWPSDLSPHPLADVWGWGIEFKPGLPPPQRWSHFTPRGADTQHRSVCRGLGGHHMRSDWTCSLPLCNNVLCGTFRGTQWWRLHLSIKHVFCNFSCTSAALSTYMITSLQSLSNSQYSF